MQLVSPQAAGRDQSPGLPGQSPWAVPTPFASDRLSSPHRPSLNVFTEAFALRDKTELSLLVKRSTLGGFVFSLSPVLWLVAAALGAVGGSLGGSLTWLL